MELNEATETVSLSGPCQTVLCTGPGALPVALLSPSCLTWTGALTERREKVWRPWALSPQEWFQLILFSTQPGF